MSADLIPLLRQPRASTPITPNDNTILTTADVHGNDTGVTKGVTIGVGGNLVYQLIGDNADRTLPVQAGQYVPGVFKLIKAATTASSIVGWGD